MTQVLNCIAVKEGRIIACMHVSRRMYNEEKGFFSEQLSVWLAAARAVYGFVVNYLKYTGSL